MNQKKSLLSVSIVSMLIWVSLYLFPALSAKAATAPPKTLNIGMISCMTGWLAVHDVPDTNEAKIAAQIINERGGITVKGQKYLIKLIVVDGQSTFDGITDAANDLVFNKKVKFIIGPAGPFAGPSAPITNSNKVLDVLIYCTNTPGQLGKAEPYTFLGYDASNCIYAGIDYIKKHFPWVKEVVVVNSDDGSLPYLTPMYKRALSDAGIKMAGLVSYPNQTVDYNPIADRINSFKKADAVLVANCIPPAVGGILKGLRALGNNKPFVQSTISSLQDVVNIAGKDAVKNVAINCVTPGAPGNPPLMNEIAKRVIAKYGPNTDLYLQAANCLWVLTQAIEAAQSLDPTVVKDRWEKMDKVNTLFGPGRMCGDKTYGIRGHAVCTAIPFQVFKDGKVVSGGWSSPIFVP